MSGTQKLIGWALFAAVVVVLFFASVPDRGLKEGHQGSYLGRSIEGQQANANRDQTLGSRAATQRF
jgi:hypothetical protein